MQALVGLGIARELSGRRRDRVFAYDRYLAILAEETEPVRQAGVLHRGASIE